ncbi:hypothetical protein LZP69_07670 [Shewanella sp. AS1]|nr:hypothetical protein [Shewanella sp. AS1]
MKWLIALLVLLLFIVQWRKLYAWSLAFWVDEAGRCAFIPSRTIELVTEPDNGSANALKTLWVSPWLVVFHLNVKANSGENTREPRKHLILVWRDMLDDTSYRHLCRLLLRFG